MKKIIILSFAAFLLNFSSAFSDQTSWQENQSGGAKIQVIGSSFTKNGQKKLIIGAHFKIKRGWKIYGNSVDGIGLPPEFDFSQSQNYQSHKIIWPKAKIENEEIGNETLTYPVYKNDVIIPVEIITQDSTKNTNLNFTINFGLCSEVCIAAHEDFSLEIEAKIDQDSLDQIQTFYPEKISNKQPSNSGQSLSLISLIVIAIIGGAILNIMPCVLPVLSIKLISVINHSEASISKIRFAFTSTIIGILSCFALLAAAAGAIKAGGSSFGWGLQFQNPFFLIFLIVILMLFIANLLGIFEINFSQFLASLLNKKINKSKEDHSIFVPNFLSGILAVLLATPCSAPFLGSAISFALSQNFTTILIIFLAIGLGFAAPYVLLLINPKLVYLLPKPGNWMNKTKQILAGLLAATIIWLFYILSHNIGMMPAILTLALATTLLGCFKIKSGRIKALSLIAIIIAIFCIPGGMNQIKNNVPENWIKFDEAKISQLVDDGKIVIVDVTADWCITCKFNKIRIFGNQKIKTALAKENIILMRGDITKPNEKIMKYLEKNNRYAIPFNAVYGPGLKDGQATKELLGKDELLDLIDKAK